MKAIALPLFFTVLMSGVAAHELRPGLLALTETRPHTFAVLWNVPMRGSMRLNLEPIFPPDYRRITPVARFEDGAASTRRWHIQGEQGLAGRFIEIEGLSTTLTDVLVRIEFRNGASHALRLTPSAPRLRLPEKTDAFDVVRSYAFLGMEHILFGFDHLLFVFCLLLLVKGYRNLIMTITAFTAAHSITLAATTLGWLWAPSTPVEAVIALSIVFLATEIARRQAQPGKAPTLTERFPWVVAFIFGLLHGMGFAGALAEWGLPSHAIPLALLFFNLGVEAGQILFVAAVLCIIGVVKITPLSKKPGKRFRWVPVYSIGGMAAFWFMERAVGLA